MKKINVVKLLVGIGLLTVTNLKAQIGYYDAPYIRYEADSGTLSNATILPKSYSQPNLQSEASNQVCVNLSNTGASVNWTVLADGDGLVVRYCVPQGQSGVLGVYANNVLVDTLNLTTYYSWQYLSSNGDPNNVGVANTNARMRFDEVRIQLPAKILAGGNLKLVNRSGTIYLDFAELEPVPASISSVAGDVVYTGNGSDLQNIINTNGGKNIYLPAGLYNIPGPLYFGVDNTVLKGAGMWYTQLYFSSLATNNGGLIANANNISYSDFCMTTAMHSRSSSYKAINGVYTSGSTITNIWAEHFECGAWFGQYNTGSIANANGFTMSYCRFRNNYADGTNLCKGTSNAIVEHCSYRNNGDDDMGIWSADGQECINNTFRFNTSENCWRSAGCAIYGGLNNQGHDLLIKDPIEVGLRVNNNFSGAPFNISGMHQFYNVTIISGGTFNDIYNNPVGAIDIMATNTAGTFINNVKFSNINIINAKNDAIYIYKTSGNGFNNLIFENIAVNGTGAEYPYNNAKGLNWGRGYEILFIGYPSGFGTYCNMTVTNLGGNAAANINSAQIGSFSWINAGCGTYITAPLNGDIFGTCDSLISISATASTTPGNVAYVDFYIDGAKVGRDSSAPYSFDWKNFTLGSHQIYGIASYSSGNAVLSSTSEITVDYYKGLIYTPTPPVIDGVIDALWSNYSIDTLAKISEGSITGPADLTASYQVSYDSTNLYVLVNITDNILLNSGGNNWENDEVELFIDIGNEKAGAYGPSDFAYNFVYNNSTVYENQHNATSGVTFAQGAKTGGYIMEISIPWSTLGTTRPNHKTLLGFDIGVDDSDVPNVRHAKKAWEDCTDSDWENTASFGTLQESGCTQSSQPIGFVSLQGQVKNGETILTWKTYYKKNNSSFTIQREIGTGSFTTIGSVTAAGTPGALTTNSYTDVTAPIGLVSYRVAQVDMQGCEILSNIIVVDVLTGTVQQQEIKEIDFYPNPFNTSGNLQINSLNAENYTISIKDMNGRIISTKNVSGGGLYLIGENLPQGVYILEVSDGVNRETIKLMKL
jgi:hypothetical protein